MIEYTYFEVVLMVAFFIALGYAFKFREEAIGAKRFLKLLIEDETTYKRVKRSFDETMEEMKNAH